MIGLRYPSERHPPNVTVTESEIWIPDEAFEPWVREGMITEDTVVCSADFGGGVWRVAADLEVFHLFRPEPPAPAQPPPLTDRLFPPVGFSGVELLLLSNIVVAFGLLGAWRGGYAIDLARLLIGWHDEVRHFWDFWRILPTIFMHADAGHLMRTLVALLATGGAVEYFYGRRKTWIIYLVTGFMGGVISYYGHARPPLSVGASGAIFGLAGVMAMFLLRYYRRFSPRQRWRARRIYGPLVVLLVLPALIQADYYAHIGGFLTGLLLGAWVPVDPAGDRLLEPQVEEAEPGYAAGDSAAGAQTPTLPR
jgi:membrane associated rhomboid family serine protease